DVRPHPAQLRSEQHPCPPKPRSHLIAHQKHPSLTASRSHRSDRARRGHVHTRRPLNQGFQHNGSQRIPVLPDHLNRDLLPPHLVISRRPKNRKPQGIEQIRPKTTSTKRKRANGVPVIPTP